MEIAIEYRPEENPERPFYLVLDDKLFFLTPGELNVLRLQAKDTYLDYLLSPGEYNGPAQGSDHRNSG